jgi:hypothetical protein
MTYKIEFIDQSTLPQGLWAENLSNAEVYTTMSMEVIPRKDDVIVIQHREGNRMLEEYHTVWGIVFLVGPVAGIRRIFSIGHRHRP